MTIAEAILWSLIGTPDERAFIKASAKYFCEQHLIAGPELSERLDRIDQELDAEEDARFRERQEDELRGRFIDHWPKERGE